jgi:flagellar biosynthesis protein FliP
MADRKLTTNQKPNDYALNSLALALALIVIYLVSVSMTNDTTSPTSRERQNQALGAAANHTLKSIPSLRADSIKQATKGAPAG